MEDLRPASFWLPTPTDTPSAPELGWVPLNLYGDNAVRLEMYFHRGQQVLETLDLTRSEFHVEGPLRVRFQFNRTFQTAMTHSPDHLTPLTVLPLIQKIYYYALAAVAGHNPARDGVRFKIWPTSLHISIPTLITRAQDVRGELLQLSRRRTTVPGRSLYPRIRPYRTTGRVIIDDSMQIDVACLVYDLADSS